MNLVLHVVVTRDTEMADIPYTTDFSLFDDKIYCDVLYSKVEGEGQIQEFLRFVLDSLLEIYNSGKLSGETLLDIGTGPTIHNLIPASPYFSNIYLSDYVERNRNALWRWLTKHPDSHDFSPFFKYLRRKDPSVYLENVEDEMRKGIKGILGCDYTLENPLYPSIYPQFDAISTSLCLDTCPDIKAYETASKNIASLLKPGGWLVMVGEIRTPFYMVGERKFSSLVVKPEEVKDTWTNLGFTVDTWKLLDMAPVVLDGKRISDSSLIIVMSAKKS